MADVRIVLVTGGGSGIGRATSKKFSDGGDHVVVADINQDGGASVVKELNSDGGEAEYVFVDVAEESSVQKMTSIVKEKWGRIDVLVNSAGILENVSKLGSMDLEEHDRVWAVNYRGTYLCCRSVGKLMADQESNGSIVNISSTSAARTFPLIAYGPAKAAIDQLTSIMASDLGPHNVRVNAVMPGYVLTEEMQARIDAGFRDRRKMDDQSALGRMVHPSEIADGIYFLCSDDAGRSRGLFSPLMEDGFRT